MKIVGIGIDIIQNKRIKNLIKNNNFINRVFSKNEILISRNFSNKSNFFAKRFAAKESLSKAIGSGIRNKLNFKDIEISNDKLGKPFYNLNKKLRYLISKRKKIKKFDLFLSISDEKEYSIAFTIIQKK